MSPYADAGYGLAHEAWIPRGFSFKDLWGKDLSFVSIYADLRLPGEEPRTTIMDSNVIRAAAIKVPWQPDFHALIRQAEQTAPSNGTLDLFLHNTPQRKINRVYLVAEGNVGYFVVGVKDSLNDSTWQAPGSSDALKVNEHHWADPTAKFLQLLSYGSEKDIVKWWGEQVIGVNVDDDQFADLPGFERASLRRTASITVYRGMSLERGQNPLTATSDRHPEGGVGSSWTLNLDAAQAMAQRGGAGMNTNNNPTEPEYLLDNESVPVPTVLRAHVELSDDGPLPYRPWSADYTSEMEIDVPPGTEIVVDGYAQATPEYPSQPDPKPDDEYRGGKWVTWQWGSWVSASQKRVAKVGFKIVATAPGTLYHGTNVALSPGGVLAPARARGGGNFDSSYTYYDPSWVYLSDQDFLAERYALLAVKKRGGEPHVYRCEPIGDVLPDPEAASGFGTDGWVARSATVIAEVSLPGNAHLEGDTIMRGPSKTADVSRPDLAYDALYVSAAARVKAAGTGGCMVAFTPPAGVLKALLAAARVSNPGYEVEPDDQVHITLVYLPDFDHSRSEELAQVVSTFAMGAKPLSGTYSGFAVFQGGGEQVLVALPDIPGLPAWRERLVEYLGHCGFGVADNHGYTPHATLLYSPDAPNVPPVLPDQASKPHDYSQVFLVIDNDWQDFDLTGKAIKVALVKDAQVSPRLAKRMVSITDYGVLYDPWLVHDPKIIKAQHYDGWAQAPVSYVDPSKLWATEPTVDGDLVDRIVAHPDQLRESYSAEVVELDDGRMVVLDGNHRAAIYSEIGWALMPVHLLSAALQPVARLGVYEDPPPNALPVAYGDEGDDGDDRAYVPIYTPPEEDPNGYP